MKTFIANFKMNQTPQETKQYLIEALPRLKNSKNNIIIFPPFTSLYVAKQLIEGFPLKLGAQNVCEVEEKGCTGEISANMLLSLDVKYVLIGHSDRRMKFHETYKLINKRIKTALKNTLKVILFVGESKAENGLGSTNSVLKKQLEESLGGLYENELANVIIAYEPLWAVGSGENVSERHISEGIKQIRDCIKTLYSDKTASKIQVLFGGSVNENNAKRILAISGVDGLVMGGAALDVEKFIKISR